MAAPITAAGQLGFLTDTSSLSSVARLPPKQTIYNQNTTPVLTRRQPIQSGGQLNLQHQQIVQKLPNILLSKPMIGGQQHNRTSSLNNIPYRTTQNHGVVGTQTAHKPHTLVRTVNSVKAMNGFGSPQIHGSCMSNTSEEFAECSPVQETIIQTRFEVTPNVSPGWLRQIIDGDIVYVSPSGAVFQKIEQIKEYLLSYGTCKCGLPCPLFPDKFFEFDPRIPNLMLENDINIDGNQRENSVPTCLHRSKSIHPFHHDAEVANDSRALALKTEPLTADRSSEESGNSLGTSNDNNTLHIVSEIMENTSTDITLSRPPPWQKNSILSQQQAIVSQTNGMCGTSVAQSHFQPQPTQLKHVKQQPPWHDESRRRNNIKKRPNFKEDPTGYLDHQTAILNNSILNLHSPVGQDESNSDQAIAEADVEDDKRMDATRVFAEETYSIDGDQKPLVPTENNPANGSNVVTERMSFTTGQAKLTSDSISFIQNYGRPHMAIGPNGQPVRIIHNPYPYKCDASYIRSTPVQAKLIENQCGNTQKKIITFPHSHSPIIARVNPKVTMPVEVNVVPLKISDDKRMIDGRTSTEKSGTSQSIERGVKNCDHINLKLNSSFIKHASTTTTTTATNPTKIFKYTGHIQRPHDSSVSSSTHQDILTIDEISPAQIRSIPTINENSSVTTPVTADVRVDNVEKSSYSTKYHNLFMAAQTSGRNTITSVLAGKAMTSTTNTIQSHMANEKMKTMRPNVIENSIHVPSHQKFIKANSNQILQITKSPIAAINSGGTSNANNLSIQSQYNHAGAIQNIQPMNPEASTNQIIVTSTGQILMMSPTVHENKNANQMIIGGPASNLVINTQNSHHVMRNEIIQTVNENNAQNIIISRNVVTGGNPNIMQSPNNSNNYILGPSNNMQSVILNNSGIISHNGSVLSPTGTTLIPSASNSSIIGTANPTKINHTNLLAQSNIINQQHVIGQTNQIIGGNTTGSLLSPNAGMVGQQTVLLNQLSNGSYVTVDGQVMNVISSDGTNQFVQQRLIVSPDSKRRPMKRKSSSASPSTQLTNESPLPSPTVQQNSTPPQQMLHITPHYQSQSFQISPGGAGITLVQNKPSPINTASQQQLILQNGSSILQPINLIGQQLILPTGLMLAPDASTYIQNVAANQQFIVNGNGQISPIGQMYSTPMMMVPHSNTGQSQFVQQTTTTLNRNVMQDVETVRTVQTASMTASASPPDTTTLSPKSPEISSSHKENGNDINMVQYVSSSEPDSFTAPDTDEQTLAHAECETQDNSSYQSSVFKPSEMKIRRIQQNSPEPHSHQSAATQHMVCRADSKDRKTVNNAENPTSDDSTEHNPTSTELCIGELIWGAARGHPAWPGKIVSAPPGVFTPNDSTWVRWFGGRNNVEMVAISSLKSLSDGLDAHHKAQKDTRNRSRKLNPQLEQAIQKAMSELDASAKSPSNTRARTTRNSTMKKSPKPVKIAPAPPQSANINTKCLRNHNNNNINK